MMAAKSKLPRNAPGHWESSEGRDMAQRYLDISRSDLNFGETSDFMLANEHFLAADDIALKTAVKERLRWLSAQLALANAERDKLAGEVEQWTVNSRENKLIAEENSRRADAALKSAEFHRNKWAVAEARLSALEGAATNALQVLDSFGPDNHYAGSDREFVDDRKALRAALSQNEGEGT